MGVIGKHPLKTALQAKTAKRRKSAHAATKIAGALAEAKANDLLPDLAVVERKIGDIKPSAKRLKQPDPKLQEALIQSIGADGQVYPVLIWKDELLDGSARHEVMTAMGATHIKVQDLSHMPRSKAMRIAVAVNRTAQLASFDMSIIRETLIVIEADGYSLDATGFDRIEQDIIKLDPLEEGISEELNEVVPVAETPPVSRLGDLWDVGKHRLLVGDATTEQSYATLLGDEQATMVVTDPPFGVPIAGNVSGLGKVKHQDFVMGCGEQTKEELEAFFTASLANMRERLMNGGAAYVFIDWRHVHQMVFAGEAAGLTLVNIAVWNKMSGGMGALLRSQHEMIPMFCNGKSVAKNNIALGAHGRDRTNVWSYPAANRKSSSASKILKDHPTPKPVEMIVEAILDVSEPGDIVLDPFLGSGTTIIAAEECGRIARGMELDPKYADVIIRRFENLTGVQAILTETGETFAEVEARRGAEDSNMGEYDHVDPDQN